ncbi:hypothetical protein CLV58_14122 [Spirosoma oryzae]|uniref:Uncharacterized protein n=1 Tax=Spirosoma oryzae TaxID=1469603 RepID=A0A2T0RQR5_9BACT|nr:hypothetical protein [Spirosoma oryzae]PRY23501.1 hypothetical protein CLV58_14122 [Spirosoma oryzae]
MKFNDNDIEALLNFDGNTPIGQYNQLQWTTDFGADATGLTAKIVSAHEFFHSELNNTTVYGCLLQSYAYLSRGKSPFQSAFKQLLVELVQQCREAHEVYATWLSITVFSQNIDDQQARNVLMGNQLYESYYTLGNELVSEFPSLYLRQQVLTACLRFCFQSQTLAQTILGHLTDFAQSSVRSSEFPNQRFHHIRQHVGPSVLYAWVNEYIEQRKGLPAIDLLAAALAGQEDTQALLARENNDLAEQLMTWIYQTLQAHFNARGSASFDSRAHLSFFSQLLEHLQTNYPLPESPNQLIPNQTPDDYERSMVVTFENETILLAQKPLSCIIRHPHELTADLTERLLQGIGDEPHLFITGRLSFLLRDQYQFADPLDEAWLRQINGPFTAIQYSYLTEQGRVVVFIPFDSVTALTQFLMGKAAGVPVLGCVAVSAAYQSAWWQEWGDFFMDQCQTSCLLLDISPLHFVEDVFIQDEFVYYGKMIINTGDRSFTTLVFQTIQAGQIQATLIAPCSDVYGSVLHYYIQHRYQQYQLDSLLTKIEYRQLPLILGHLFKEERSFYFRSPNTQFL